ncbi:MAG: hypothetical protein A3G32_04390 [Deltaproteobacteria bacterium RIFCSPLOWO2_12_FULL_40_28]|nr:MAG: hypothetical protein A3C45_08500 [Deltaproteobacteria bacterium RIFCSPHIGHO2_02_FULL_40_28]OGQ19610.1 MAG: hypothetical protein A3E27_07695 [Deltaproteobacteria bacterium RIFCSPHIGHO2_12_FULL_40_32]OGQ40887.1 MAG: hypothetical protein A3I69_03110 [Deltaproteobacteria bacterium RIFCSPLOWO2_02_FULL_40_36]OGQ54002.1 MAG: hypothetical protein A3G32_04390 [Deltaproteobacteria bacterium RIFCSPLOWO2_12_FULL_40_28]
MNYKEFQLKVIKKESVFLRGEFDFHTNLVKWVALKLAYMFYHIGISANFLDIFSLFGNIVGFILFSRVDLSIGWHILALFLIYFYVLVDFIDGALAKARNEMSQLGDRLDHFGCRIARFAMMVLIVGYLNSMIYLIVMVFCAGALIFLYPETESYVSQNRWVQFLKKIFVNRFSFLSVRYMLFVSPLILLFLIHFKVEYLIIYSMMMSFVYFIMTIIWLAICAFVYEKNV